MGEWKALVDLIGVDIIDTAPFAVGLMLGSLILSSLGPALVSYLGHLGYIAVGIVGNMGLTIVIGFIVLDSYEDLVAKGASGTVLGMISALPYIFFLIAVTGTVIFTLAWREHLQGGGEDEG